MWKWTKKLNKNRLWFLMCQCKYQWTYFHAPQFDICPTLILFIVKKCHNTWQQHYLWTWVMVLFCIYPRDDLIWKREKTSDKTLRWSNNYKRFVSNVWLFWTRDNEIRDNNRTLTEYEHENSRRFHVNKDKDRTTM